MGNQASRKGVTWRQAVAWCGLATLLAGAVLIVIYASSGRSPLVYGSPQWTDFPGWLAGPLHGLAGHVAMGRHQFEQVYSVLILAMTVAYFSLLWAWRSLPMRAIAVFAVAIQLVLLLGPPIQLTDLFNYLAYARLGVLHGLNPYTHVTNADIHDPTYQLATWHNWHSPYGTLFTALTYPIALLPLPAAYWTLKLLTILFSLMFLWLIARCAQLLGRDPRLPVLMVAANPLYLIYAVAEFHNDFFMLVPALGAIALLLSGRYRRAGAAAAAAVTVKVTMIVLVPFLILAAWRRRATRRLVVGIVLGAVPLVVMSLIMFGPVLPNVSGQSRLLTAFSVPNLLGWAIGLGGGTPGLVRDMNAVIVAVVAFQLLRRRDWLTGAGWATLALLASLGWLMPWYVIWLLPLAALAPSISLRRTALAATVFTIVTFLPALGLLLNRLEINPTASPVGVAAWRYQWNAQNARPQETPSVYASELRAYRRCRATETDCDMRRPSSRV